MSRFLSLAATCVFGVAAAAASANTPTVLVLAPEAKVAGLSQSQYTVRWWLWANRQPYDAKPYQDETGELCAVDQAGPVFFLAGTDGSGPFHRRCSVPAGKYLLMPVINNLSSNRPGYRYTCQQMVESSGANNEYLTKADVRIDGVRVPDVAAHRQKSPACFNPFPDNPDARGYFPAASDGYWLMIPPLPPGSHTITVNAKYNNPDCRCAFHDMEQEFDYVIEVGGSSGSNAAPSRAMPAKKTTTL